MRHQIKLALSTVGSLWLVACDATTKPSTPEPPNAGVFEITDFTLYIPDGAPTLRGLVIVLGGPDTRGFISDVPLGAPLPEVEAALKTFGADLRSLASSERVAVLGTAHRSLPNSAATDQLLTYAIGALAEQSSRPELRTVPIHLHGMSGGAPEAAGFAARNPQRVAGLSLKVPLSVTALTASEVLAIPTYVIQSELDVVVNNAPVATTFEKNRAAGGLWALAVEPGVPHHSLSPAARTLLINWIRTVLDLRIPATAGPLRQITESAGWLGDRATGAVSDWASYSGNRTAASWFPSQNTASEWRGFTKTGASQ